VENGNERISACLMELGLDETAVSRYLNSSCFPEKLCILTKFRAGLLEKLHQDQRSLECLDYIIYELRKSEGR